MSNNRQKDNVKTPTAPRRGSVLVFTVLLLVLLAGIGTSFVMFVNMEYAASGNALRSTQSRAAAETALEHARLAIRNSLLNHRFEAPEGVFGPDDATGYLETSSTTNPGLFRFIEYHMGNAGTPIISVSDAKNKLASDMPNPSQWNTWRDFAWLYWNSNEAYCGVASLDEGSGALHKDKDMTSHVYTESPLSHFAYPNGAPRFDRKNGLEHAGHARRFLITTNVEDFYEGTVPFKKEKNAQFQYRGEYYIWIADLDGKLFAPYKDQYWDMDDLIIRSIDPDTGEVVQETQKSADIAKAILAAMNSFGSTASTWGTTDGHAYAGMKLDALQPAPSTANWIDRILSRSAPPSALQQLAVPDSLEQLAFDVGQTTPPSAKASDPTSVPPVWDYLHYRYGLERYFTVWQDTDKSPTAPKPIIKPTSTALNINTANFETLAAVLSQIPLVDDYLPSSSTKVAENVTKASALAKRICAKRPFVCRIDFEDFLAAHLNVDPTGTIIDDPRNGATVPQPPVRMVYLAIPKREYTDANDTTVPRTVLTLSQLMEATVTDTDSRYTWLRSAADQQSRFLWFRDLPLYADSTAPLSDAGGNAFLSVKAFNNILNSTSGERPGGGYGYSFYSYDSVAVSFGGTKLGVPKFEYNELKNTPSAGITAGTDTYVIERGDTSTNDEVGELFAWRLTKSTGYYETVFKDCDDTQIFEYAKLIPIACPVPPAQVAVISAGTDKVLQTPAISDGITTDDIAGTNSIDDPSTGDFVCDSTIHAPLRAYRHTHTSEPVVTDAAFNTDVSWSPRFCFRSRFFKVYVLARSIVTLKGSGAPVYGPTSRLEAVYDAVDDKILWRRWQATELRRLSDPVP